MSAPLTPSRGGHAMSEKDSKAPETPAVPPNAKDSFFSDLSALRLDGAGASASAVEVLSHIPVRKPNRHEFFRVHQEWALATTVFINKEDRDEIYLVTPEMRVALLGEARPVLLAPAISRLGLMFVWPVSLPGEDGRRSPW